jgi:hypothetical protein
MILALTGKAVIAAEVTGVSNMEAESFNYGIALLKIKGFVFIGIRSK